VVSPTLVLTYCPGDCFSTPVPTGDLPRGVRGGTIATKTQDTQYISFQFWTGHSSMRILTIQSTDIQRSSAVLTLQNMVLASRRVLMANVKEQTDRFWQSFHKVLSCRTPYLQAHTLGESVPTSAASILVTSAILCLLEFSQSSHLTSNCKLFGAFPSPCYKFIYDLITESLARRSCISKALLCSHFHLRSSCLTTRIMPLNLLFPQATVSLISKAW
jgi:hypothetical protein